MKSNYFDDFDERPGECGDRDLVCFEWWYFSLSDDGDLRDFLERRSLEELLLFLSRLLDEEEA